MNRTVISAVAVLACVTFGVSAFGAERPNLIYLMTDDQRAGALGCMSNRIIQTPHIDRMAADGAYSEVLQRQRDAWEQWRETVK